MSNVYRAGAGLAALALVLITLANATQTASALVLGTVTFRTGQASTTAAVSFATNATGSGANEVWVHVTDADLPASPSATTTVAVRSTIDGTGFALMVTLESSGGGTVNYSGKLTLTAATSNAASGSLQSTHGGTVTATYTDTTTNFGSVGIPKNLTVDAVGPVFSGLTPSDGTITKTASQTYKINIKDVDSGVDETAGTYGFLFNLDSTVFP